MTTDIVTTKPAQFDLSPQTFEQALTFAQYLADSSMVPKDFKGNAGNCLIAMQWGMEVGLKPLQALQNIAVINGRPSLWGDSVIAIVRSSPLCEYVSESDDGNTATCRVKRVGEPETFRTFSMEDAKTAGLAGKEGPWRQYPKRMRQMRARAFALRDVFPDVLRGMPIAEELMDMPRDMGHVEEVGEATTLWNADTLATARAAVAKGASAYGAFWKTLPPEEQARLVKTPEHATNKADALKADSARTFDTSTEKKAAGTDTTAPVVTFAKVMASLVGAKTLDELGDAADWIGEVPDEVQRRELKAKYEELANAMERA